MWILLSSALAAPPSLAHLPFDAVDLQGQPYRAMERRWSVSDVGGTGVTVTVLGSSELRVYDLAQYARDPSVRGNGLIDWSWSGERANGDGIVFAFDPPVASVAISAGDWSSDDDSDLVLQAIGCDGKLLARAASPWTIERVPPFASLVVSASPGAICRVVYRSGGAFAGSTFVHHLWFDRVADLRERIPSLEVSPAGGLR